MGIKPISDHKPPVQHVPEQKTVSTKALNQTTATDRAATQKALQQNPGSHPAGCGCPVHSGSKATKVEHEHHETKSAQSSERALVQKALHDKSHSHKAGDGCPVCTGDKAAKLDKGNIKASELTDLKMQRNVPEFLKSEKSSIESVRTEFKSQNLTQAKNFEQSGKTVQADRSVTIKLGNLFPSHTQIKLQTTVPKQISPLSIKISDASEKVQLINLPMENTAYVERPASPQNNRFAASEVPVLNSTNFFSQEPKEVNFRASLIQPLITDSKQTVIIQNFSAKELALIELSLKSVSIQPQFQKQSVKNDLPVLKAELKEQVVKVLGQPMISFQALKNALSNRVPDMEVVKLFFALMGRQLPEGEIPDLEGAWGIWRDYIKNRSKNKEEQNSQKRKKQIVPVIKKRKSDHEH